MVLFDLNIFLHLLQLAIGILNWLCLMDSIAEEARFAELTVALLDVSACIPSRSKTNVEEHPIFIE